MAESNCPDRELLSQLMLGKLRGRIAEDLENHILHCKTCSDIAEEIEVVDSVLAALAREIPFGGDEQYVQEAIARAKQISIPETLQVTRDFGQESTDAESAGGDSREKIDFLAPPEAPDEIGRLGNYRVLEVIGAGGMGIVLRAEDVQLKRQVALKVMKPAIAASGSAKERFLKEAEAAATIEHDHIVTIFQIGEDRGIPFIAMPYLQGETLQMRLNRERQLDQQEVVRIGRQIALGLAAAHEKGLIHRDIKPDNIWLDSKQDRVKILDFGLARSTRDDSGLTQSGMVVGTPKYMAPEQANGEPVDDRCDLFSFGSVLYHLAGGRPPFEGPTVTATLLAVTQTSPMPIQSLCPKLHPKLADLIMRLLSKDRADRPQTAEKVTQTLAEIEQKLEVEPTIVNAPSLGPLRESESAVGSGGGFWPANRRRTIVGGFSFLILLGIIIIVSRPGGTPTTIEVPFGSTNKIDDRGNLHVTIPKPQPARDQAADEYDWPADAPRPAIAPFGADEAKKHQESWAKHLGVPVEYTNRLGMTFRLIPPGEFMMGSTDEEIDVQLQSLPDYDAGYKQQWIGWIRGQGPQHRVIIRKAFYLSIHEVTQHHYSAIVGTNPSLFRKDGPTKRFVDRLESGDTHHFPVEGISWDDAVAFCKSLSRREFHVHHQDVTRDAKALLDMSYRLPTEAEWEYACRAGTITTYSLRTPASDPLEVAWAWETSKKRPHPVGSLKANPFGLFDMHGNVWEWCGDWYDSEYYANSPIQDPTGPGVGSLKIYRGGSSCFGVAHCGSAVRVWALASGVNADVGFRIVLPVSAVKQAM